MKLLTFLGTGNYQSTTYTWQGQQAETSLFPAALARFLNPSITLICATPKVEAHENLAKLKQELEQWGKPNNVLPIPNGDSEDDLWQIFNALTSAVDEGEEVVFDITHSFRSLPFLSFLAVAYLKTAKNVNVKHVLYGAYEAQREGKSPVFDLTPFVALLDWTTATDQFVRTGDGQWLAELLRQSDKKAGMALNKVSQAALLCQPFTLMSGVSQMNIELEAVEQLPAPFGVLKEQLQRVFGPFSVDNPPQSAPEMLCAEMRMIEWYHASHQYVQMITLAREWLIDAATLRLGLPVDNYKQQRKDVEKGITGQQKLGSLITDEPRPFDVDDLNDYGRLIHAWPEQAVIAELVQLFELRNRLNHAQHQPETWPVDTIRKKIDKMLSLLRQLAQAWCC